MPLFLPCTSKRIQGFQISFYGRGLFSNYNPFDPYVGSYGLRRKVNATESNPQKNVRTSCFVRIFHRQNSVHIHLWRDTCATLSSGARNSWFPFTHTRMIFATNTFTLHTKKGACLLRISSLSDHVRPFLSGPCIKNDAPARCLTLDLFSLNTDSAFVPYMRETAGAPLKHRSVRSECGYRCS